MMSFRVFLLGTALTAAATIPACGLSAFDDASGSGLGGGYTTAGTGGGIGDDASIDIGPDGVNAPDPFHRYVELCGEGCTPGAEPDACADGGAGGAGGAGGGEATLKVCQLVPEAGRAAPACGAPGAFGPGGPCASVADCAVGLGCAGTGEMTGVCRQYCCGHVEDCAAGTYCAPQPMQEDAVIPIPLCIPADDCELLADSCPPELTCTIVRTDGTTSCRPPGTGVVGDKCSDDYTCAPGFVCSLLTNECKKLCHLGEDVADCGANAICQGGSMGFPDGFGICFGGDY